jgi:hypothetical protein
MRKRVSIFDQVVEPRIKLFKICVEVCAKRGPNAFILRTQAYLIPRYLAFQSPFIDPHPCQIIDAAVHIRKKRLNVYLRVKECVSARYLILVRWYQREDVLYASLQCAGSSQITVTRILCRLLAVKMAVTDLKEQPIIFRLELAQHLFSVFST